MVAERNFTTAGDFDLRQLPEFAPDANLWPRIEAAQRARQRWHLWRNGGFGVAAAMLAGVAVLLLPQPLPNTSQDVVAGQHESQSLENEWQQLVGSAHPALVGTTQLRVIDAALQSAYDRDAKPEELAPLWQERNLALRGLIARFQDKGLQDALAVTRI